MTNFWKKLPKPFTVLSPMEDITDTVMRQMLIKIGRPDVFFTEFVNVDGMFSLGQNQVRHRLKFSPKELPLVAQIWGNDPDNFYKASKEISQMGFSGIDINMGCSQSDVLQHNCGAALIGQEKLVNQIIHATKKGAGKLPVSVKTRLGIKSIDVKTWIPFLLQQNIQAIILHARRAKDNYLNPANWEEIGCAVKLRNQINPDVLIIGNGDVQDLLDVQSKVKQFNVDGVAVGRYVLSNPWCFTKTNQLAKITVTRRLKLLNQHANLFKKTWGDKKPYQMIKKYIKMYIQGFPQAANMRAQLMQSNNYSELKLAIKNLL